MWTQASQQLIRAIRAHRSQEAFCRRVGVSAATIAAWENGRRFPTLDTVIAACTQWGDDPCERLTSFHPVLFDRYDVPGWLTALQGSQTHAELATKANASRHQIGRWMSGRATPRLPEFLALLHALTGRAEDFVALWVPIQHVPVLQAAWAQRQQTRTLAWEEPWTEAILQLVRTGTYREHAHPNAQVVASWLGAPADDIARALNRLREVGLLVAAGTHDLPGASLTVDTGADPAAVQQLKRHWATVAANNVDTNNALCAYNIFACSQDDLDIVREELLGAFRRARARIAASDADDHAALLMVQLCPIPMTPTR